LSVIAGILSGAGIILALICVMFVIYFSGKEFAGFAYLFSVSHGVLVFIEGIVTSITVTQILKIKPQMLYSFNPIESN
jgi:ABC-type Co2+ transport system permease subunit